MDKNMKILVVDDFSTMRRIIKNLLRDLGFTNTQEADDGNTGLPMLQSGNFDFLITDWNMPGMTGIECLATDGTFYVFPSVKGLIDAIDGVNDDLQLAEHLIEHAGVALVPGTAFGLGGHARISIATSMQNLEKALDRIEKVIG